VRRGIDKTGVRGPKQKRITPGPKRAGLIMDGSIEPDFDALEETELELRGQYGGANDQD
jgi:hypothetical protein